MGALSDEPPIRVRNGSMTITLVSGKWKADGKAWTPLDGKNGGGFIVVVEIATRSGRTLGQPVFGKEVEISYSDGAVIRFKRGTLSKKTKVTPKRDLQLTSDPVLEYGQPGKGYITGVEVKDGGTSWRCGFESRAALAEIDIYPLPNTLRGTRRHARRKK
jgi:hypothetical protein